MPNMCEGKVWPLSSSLGNSSPAFAGSWSDDVEELSDVLEEDLAGSELDSDEDETLSVAASAAAEGPTGKGGGVGGEQ